MVIEIHDETAPFCGSWGKLTFVAFYADTPHHFRPIPRGSRVVLTYTLRLDANRGGAAVPPRQVDALAQQVRRVFETPPAPRWAHDKEREPPDRLVYLLDHEYTARGLGWNRLKNADAVRVDALREVARQLDAEIVLALADVHETWSCEDDSFDDRRYGYGRYGYGRHGYGGRWSRHHEDEHEIDGRGTDALTLTELIESDVELRHWVGSGPRLEAITSAVNDAELCYTKASVTMQPFNTEHEGYMGNWGNTVDRWYHRAAVVLWPRERTFVIRARASAQWAMGEVAAALAAGDQDEARRMTERLRPFWARTAQQESHLRFFTRTLAVAADLDTPDLAAVLLQPFRLTRLTANAARRLIVLLDRYGLEWCRALLDQWASDGPHAAADAPAAWLASTLPDVCRTLCAGDSPDGTDLTRALIEQQWTRIVQQRNDARSRAHPKQRFQALTRLADPMLGLIEASLVARHAGLHGEMVESLASADDPVGALAHLLRRAHERYPHRERRGLGLASLHARCAQELTGLLSAPVRARDNWSISTSVRCACTLCATLTRFLMSPGDVTLEWPLAKEHRRHIHGIVDLHDLPVSHTTRRSGRPFTLVLTKTAAVFERDAAERRSWKSELTWLKKTSKAF
jgi:hypothetical protein